MMPAAVSSARRASDCFEVSRFSGGFHLGQLLIDLIVGELGGAGQFFEFGADVFFAAFGFCPVEDGFHLGLIVVFEHGEDGVEAFERGEQGLMSSW